MPANTIDEYLAELDDVKRATLSAIRSMLLELEPKLVEGIAWGAPVFKYNGKNVASIAAFKNHLVYAPQSTTAMDAVASLLGDYETAKATFKFAVDHVPSRDLIAALLAARIAEVS